MVMNTMNPYVIEHFANILHLYIHCIVADVARLLQSCNALFDGDCNIVM